MTKAAFGRPLCCWSFIDVPAIEAGTRLQIKPFSSRPISLGLRVTVKLAAVAEPAAEPTGGTAPDATVAELDALAAAAPVCPRTELGIELAQRGLHPGRADHPGRLLRPLGHQGRGLVVPGVHEGLRQGGLRPAMLEMLRPLVTFSGATTLTEKVKAPSKPRPQQSENVK